MPEMAGPWALRLPPNATPLDMLIAGAVTPDPALLEGYLKLAKETGPHRLKRIQDETAAIADENTLTHTRGMMNDLLRTLTSELQKLWIPGWDELLDNPTASDSLALSERLRPIEYQVTFVRDSQDRLEVRIAAARLRRLEATWERKKIEGFESQLLCAISVLETETKMATIREQEGGAVVFGKRSQTLRQAASEAMRQVGLAEDALRQERKAQLATEQVQMAQGTITRAAIASACVAE